MASRVSIFVFILSLSFSVLTSCSLKMSGVYSADSTSSVISLHKNGTFSYQYDPGCFVGEPDIISGNFKIIADTIRLIPYELQIDTAIQHFIIKQGCLKQDKKTDSLIFHFRNDTPIRFDTIKVNLMYTDTSYSNSDDFWYIHTDTLTDNLQSFSIYTPISFDSNELGMYTVKVKIGTLTVDCYCENNALIRISIGTNFAHLYYPKDFLIINKRTFTTPTYNSFETPIRYRKTY